MVTPNRSTPEGRFRQSRPLKENITELRNIDEGSWSSLQNIDPPGY
jgi:hypothetical protein